MVSPILIPAPVSPARSHDDAIPFNPGASGTASTVTPQATSLSAHPDVFSAVESFFDLNRSGRFDQVQALPAEERRQFYKIVGTLLMNGYIGYETLVVDHKIERHDVTLQIGDRRLRHARIYRGP